MSKSRNYLTARNLARESARIERRLLRRKSVTNQTTVKGKINATQGDTNRKK